MKQNKKFSVLILLMLLQFAAVFYASVYNEGRLVKPMDFSTYQFHTNDLPMIIATACFVIYMFYFIFSMIISSFKVNKVNKEEKNKTRSLNPKFGWFGFFGFFGFFGIMTYMEQRTVWPFMFFVFFGFFGFFYEAKLSNTLIDERFKEEKTRADLSALKTGFFILFLVTWFMGFVGDKLSTDVVAIAYIVSSSLIIALVIFLSSYLLYKYDTEDIE